AIIVISAQLRVLAGLASGLFAPTQTALWAQDNMAAFESYLIRSIRLTTMMMALFVGVFCGTAKVVLSLWLSPKFGTLAPTAVMLTWYLVPTLGIMPIWNALLAAGKVKIPALITLAMGAGNVVLSIVLAKYMGLMGIALACCITLVLKNAVWTPWYTSRVCNINTLRLWRELALGTIFGALIALLSYGATTILGPQTKFMLFVTLSLSTCLGLIIAAPMIFRELLRMRPKYSASRR
ncbi:MAG TPA: hypothetical protein PKJ68_06545, partial [Candidatus Woesebacteria bacterium]|nr:hypothetical protein [Candidatus Woesebacteria bacterium]